jgi:hypothetical protein
MHRDSPIRCPLHNLILTLTMRDLVDEGPYLPVTEVNNEIA